MKHISIVLYKSTKLKNGGHPIVLRITKNRARKFISLNLSAQASEWNDEFSLFKKNKRINPEYEKQNTFINSQIIKAKNIIDEFDRNNIDWTLNQFEEAFLNRSKKGKVKPFIEGLINTLNETNHIGNANCYTSTLNMLEIFDKSFDKKVFSEIDIKYIRTFDAFLQIPRETTYTSKKGNKRTVLRKGCSGNTRKYYMKALRAIINKAIESNEASPSTYPFGKGGFEIAKLEEETEKRYLPSDYLLKTKTKKCENLIIEFTRKLFLFSYFCYGISFVDMAHLKISNLKRLENGKYIVYKRQKTINGKGSKAIYIKITDEIESLISDLCNLKTPVEGYLLPIITREGLTGKKLYDHIKNRLKTINKNLGKLAELLGIDDIDLTTYVSRHTMAMSLQNNNIPREIISQILNHKNLKTTNTYLDSFNSTVIDEAAKVL